MNLKKWLRTYVILAVLTGAIKADDQSLK